MVDAMGGDNAPLEIVKGCIEALSQAQGFDVTLVGDQQRIQAILDEQAFKSERLKIVHTTEIIDNHDAPTKAIKAKKDSSMVVGFNLLKEGKGNVLISAGNTGALMTGALFMLGRMKGVDRPALAPLIPRKNGNTMIIDAGLNTECMPLPLLL